MMRTFLLLAGLSALVTPWTAQADDDPAAWLAKLPSAPTDMQQAYDACGDSTNYKLASFDRHIDFAISQAQDASQQTMMQSPQDLVIVQQYLNASDLPPMHLGMRIDTTALDADLQKQASAPDKVRAASVDAWLRRTHADWQALYEKVKKALDDPKAPKPSKKPGDGGIGPSGQQQLLAARLQAIKSLADQGGQICSEAVSRAPAQQ